jgi:hypothetical protein
MFQCILTSAKEPMEQMGLFNSSTHPRLAELWGIACEATNSAGIKSTITSEPVEHFEEKYTGGPNQSNIFSHELAQVLRIIMRASWWPRCSIKNMDDNTVIGERGHTRGLYHRLFGWLLVLSLNCKS